MIGPIKLYKEGKDYIHTNNLKQKIKSKYTYSMGERGGVWFQKK